MITKIPALPKRVESGPMQFGDDWPGVFLRGDDALFFAKALEALISQAPKQHFTVDSMVRGLLDTLRSCSVGDTGWPP